MKQYIYWYKIYRRYNMHRIILNSDLLSTQIYIGINYEIILFCMVTNYMIYAKIKKKLYIKYTDMHNMWL